MNIQKVLATLNFDYTMIQNQIAKEVDVLVIGSGAAGMTAATVAAQQGLKVLLAEKAGVFGGTTAWSGGAIWVPNNPVQKRVGLEDSKELGEIYLKNILKESYDPDLIGAYLKSGPEMIEYMEANTEVRFTTVKFPDYWPNEEGAGWGRTIFSIPYNGAVLGKNLKKARLPIIGFSAVFGTMQVSATEAGIFTSVFKSLKSFFHVTGHVLKYISHLIRFGRGAYLANGNALSGRLYKSALDSGVELWNYSPGLSLLRDGQKVTGAIVEHRGKPTRIVARKGVVIATGGFGANPHMREKYYSKPEAHVNVNPDEVEGDGILAALNIDAAMGEKTPDQAVWAPTSIMKLKNGTFRKYPHFGPDRSKPGQIIVDVEGKRFVNEAAPYVPFVHTMKGKNISRAFMIADSRARNLYGMGFALPKPYPDFGFSKSGYLVSAPTIKELAKKLGINPEALEETVNNYNHYAKEGKDPEYHKGENNYDLSQGDPEYKPNPNVGPIERAPFYAIEMYPGDVNSTIGIVTNKNAHVLDNEGNIIEGLFAAGADAHSIFSGVYPGGGSGIGPGMAFGYRSALFMAGKEELL